LRGSYEEVGNNCFSCLCIHDWNEVAEDIRTMLVKQGTFWRASISSASSCSVAVVSLFFLMSSLRCLRRALDF
jgi:hypothetical protein